MLASREGIKIKISGYIRTTVQVSADLVDWEKKFMSRNGTSNTQLILLYYFQKQKSLKNKISKVDTVMIFTNAFWVQGSADLEDWEKKFMSPNETSNTQFDTDVLFSKAHSQRSLRIKILSLKILN